MKPEPHQSQSTDHGGLDPSRFRQFANRSQRVADPSAEPDPPRPLQPTIRVLNGLKGWQAIPASIIALYCLLGIFGPLLAPFDPHDTDIRNRLNSPCWHDWVPGRWTAHSDECNPANILGTDNLGRDIFSKLLHGTRESFSVVSSSVLIGTVIGVTCGVLINGLSHRLRWIGYAIVGSTAIPLGILVLSQPDALVFFGIFDLPETNFEWATVTAFSCVSFVVVFALVAIAYRYDPRCVSSWIMDLGDPNRSGRFVSRMSEQVAVLWPWLGLAIIASTTLIFLHNTLIQTLPNPPSLWAIERPFLSSHIGIMSPIAPMILIPIACVSSGAWWFFRHLLHRFNQTSKSGSKKEHNEDFDCQEPIDLNDSEPLQDPATQSDAQPLRTQTKSISFIRQPILRRLLLITMLIGIALVIALSTIANPLLSEREAEQNRHKLQTLTQCVEMLRPSNPYQNPPEEIRPFTSNDRCVELYAKYRNAPSHHRSFDFVLETVPWTLTLTLIGATLGMALSLATSASSTGVRRTVLIIIVIVGLTGLAMTFGLLRWYIVLGLWTDLVITRTVAEFERTLSIQNILSIFRDLSLSLGIAYFATTTANIILQPAQPKLNRESLTRWLSFLIPCIALTTGLLTVFHHPFPSIRLSLDDYLGIIAQGPEAPYYISPRSLLHNWLWTYWFALIGYAAIVSIFFATAIWGFRRFANGKHILDGIWTDDVSPNNPSQDADPT